MKPDCYVSATTTNLFSIEWKGKCLAKWKIFMISLLFSTLQLLAETFFYLNDFQSYTKTLQKNKFIFNEANLKILQVKKVKIFILFCRSLCLWDTKCKYFSTLIWKFHATFHIRHKLETAYYCNAYDPTKNNLKNVFALLSLHLWFVFYLFFHK